MGTQKPTIDWSSIDGKDKCNKTIEFVKTLLLYPINYEPTIGKPPKIEKKDK